MREAPLSVLRTIVSIDGRADLTYRVYLEGAVAGSFERELESVRREPERLALEALTRVECLLKESSQA